MHRWLVSFLRNRKEIFILDFSLEDFRFLSFILVFNNCKIPVNLTVSDIYFFFDAQISFRLEANFSVIRFIDCFSFLNYSMM